MATRRDRSKKHKPAGERGTGKGLAPREYLFESTPVLVSLPAHLYQGPVLQGVLTGSWKVRPTSRSELRVMGLKAFLFLPRMFLRLEGYEDFVELSGEPIPLSQSTFKVPNYIQRQFGPLNAGKFDPRERFVSTTVGVRGREETFGAFRGVFTTFGFVGKDSVLVSGGVAIILSGLLQGTILCCCAPRRPRQEPPADEAPPPPTGRCTFKDSGETHDRGNFTDISDLNAGGNKLPFTPGGPTAADKLGYVEGTYDGTAPDGRTVQANGFFKKIEVEVTADPGTTIVKVERTMTQLPGHNFGNAHPANAPDPIDATRSIPVKTPRRWVITDAPGMIVDRTRVANRIFYKQYTITATFDRGGQQFTSSCTYTVLIRTDANGNIIENPTPP